MKLLFNIAYAKGRTRNMVYDIFLGNYAHIMSSGNIMRINI